MQFAARSLPRAVATASAPQSLLGRGEKGGGDRVHVPTAASPGVMDGCLLRRGSDCRERRSASHTRRCGFVELLFPKRWETGD